uniref:Uncharacterized protein n=1 Tax=Mola mola TaxID=94237 RepID=A0A3Q3WQU7_MOLML
GSEEAEEEAEEHEEEEEEEEEEQPEDSRGGEPIFHIVGTSSASAEEESFLVEQYRSLTREELLKRLLECDVVLYNMSENATEEQIEEATWIVTALRIEVEKLKTRKTFILISTVMTWAMTKLQNLVSLEEDEDFKRRRPHPSFKNHNNLEKLVLNLGRGKKPKLTSYVVACGHQYGKGENLFHYFFKFPKVPVFGEGTNYIPVIHVYDLGGVLKNIIELKPKSKYIVAVDQSNYTLEDIVKLARCYLLCSVLNKLMSFQPEELACLSIDLRLDPFIIKDAFSLRWRSEAGMVDNIESIVEEYKETRQLLPIRICLVGPPAVGKTTVAERLCRHYQIHHIKIKEVIEEKMTRLVSGKEMVSGAEFFTEEEKAAAQEQLENCDKSMETNAGRLDDNLLSDILREKLNSKPCRNQGFVLDGFPKTYEQAQLIFTENQPMQSRKPLYNKKIIPDHIFTLNATNDFLKMRARGLPQSLAAKMRYTEEEFVPRLERYRERSAAEDTVLDYFDELEIHPEHIGTGLRMITEIVGSPKNYGLSPEEQEEEDRRKEEERKHDLAVQAAERKRRNEAALVEMTAQYEEWRNLSELKRQEQQLLEARALPLRNYLMKYVMPSLSEALLDCSKIKPEDPVDFLVLTQYTFIIKNYPNMIKYTTKYRFLN